MAVEYVLRGLLVIAGLSLVGMLLVQVGLVSAPWGPDEGEVRVFDGEVDEKSTADGDGNRTPKAVVDVAVADSGVERYTGLSDHDSLEPGNGMLFVHDEEREQTYVMRGMDFDIDIVFIDADREITTIHHARAPGPDEDGEELRYTGRGKWVLEVPRGYANATGIEVGDEVDIDLENRGGIIWSSPETVTQAVTMAEHEPIAPGAVVAERGSVRR
ncbi:DUF192 domain-containing protein [Natrinema altunense]|uniref:DUF192 domain-containing protein n=1 Tax=Natrinema altunense (strain JCM 12890 / CGMCC 1.3731 / AJ2) TaxID=1227494 RepID=L9ZZ27_NATA2|nr:DUF192 domain-containing protein [Natrinema altunense]ELY91569.1 hypothetical protein C485_01035 [Natrinema altunense JCM 12890]